MKITNTFKMRTLLEKGTLAALALWTFVVSGNGKTVLTQLTIKQLRQLVSPGIPSNSSVGNLLKDDLYLAKWLESSSMDINKAGRKILEHARWLQVTGIDKIDRDYSRKNCSEFDVDYPLFVGSEDKEGSPVAEIWLNEWNLRRAIVTGQGRKLTSRLQKMAELQQRQLFEARAKGKNVTHATLLLDVGGFNVFTQGCSNCLQLLSYWIKDWEDHYPDLYNRIIMINATPAIHIFTNVIRAALRKKSVDALQVYTGEMIWRRRLDNIIDRNQRSKLFGGTLKLKCS